MTGVQTCALPIYNPKPQKSGKVEFMAPSGSYRADPTKNPISIWGAKSTFVKQKNLV